MWKRIGGVRLEIDLNVYSRIFKSLWSWIGWDSGDYKAWDQKIGSSKSLWTNDWVRLKRKLLQWSRGEGERLWLWMAAAWKRGRGGLKRLMLYRWKICRAGDAVDGRLEWKGEGFWLRGNKFFLNSSIGKINGKRGFSSYRQSAREKGREVEPVYWWDLFRIDNRFCIYVKHYQE